MTRPVLILGGTGEARALASLLVADGVSVVSSLAGRVRNPRLPDGEVRIGGFGGVEGMVAWLRENQPHAVVDATHPFAQQISRNAVEACAEVGVPLVRLVRPAWEAQAGDDWTIVEDIVGAARAVAGGNAARVLLTTGRQDADAFAGIDSAWFLIRVVDPPTGPLPPHHRIVRSRGPYGLDDERTLMADEKIDLLVTKNSGGELTRAKLIAARELGIPVVMVARPVEPCGNVVTSVEEAANFGRK
ncbi:MAG TPA: cobalt-precorrin-6A reductase [Gordonia sp. (in: high G+C Gram-positive bacteria)]|uniref:cobalt-precorrin-6A reductase n=1 Tax=unclassified Gordonia (in: high G+C Gram-positive bacteria) TaxID=2657482 RepID=UPI000F986E2E|nr:MULTISPECIES: cobalt-precorrin-6A reductase [unclassified Gordonia (in: high G+C Gram-positive bacteria)]RUP38663.1 MAG: cobalt-precorrin-6A reductase [Gordonia sp. (in: high G+C Gram-positive bacteria)]HNP56343.1 cobalt-precorrin-6A reductase [Gordonia sp. (in: high G+C Gram-positive bacteria)]HRC50027.1 cobalt-precorrin-6A reductase [Gordonia sp. (in: high G+C Gram-positive bacteria)]